MTDVGTTQDNFILPALPVGLLPISQDQLNRMKLVHNHTIPIILPPNSFLAFNYYVYICKISFIGPLILKVGFLLNPMRKND